jgi:hypothetical protein
MTVWGSNPDRSKKFFSSPVHPGQLWCQPTLKFSGYWGSFPRVTQPGHEVNHSPVSSAKLKNEWSYMSIPHICLHGMYGDNFTIFTYISNIAC